MIEPKDLVSKRIEIDGNEYLIDCVFKVENQGKPVGITKFNIVLIPLNPVLSKIDNSLEIAPAKVPKNICIKIKSSAMDAKLLIIKNVKEAFLLGLKETKDIVDESLEKGNQIIIDIAFVRVSISQIQSNLASYPTFESIEYIY